MTGTPYEILRSVARRNGPLAERVEQGLRSALGTTASWVVTRTDAELGDFEIRLDAADTDRAARRLADVARLGDVCSVGSRVFVRVSDAVIAEEMAERAQPVDPFESSSAGAARVALLFSNPNSNKPLHLGHFRQNALGMALYRQLTAAGFDTHGVSLNGDWGIHIVQALVGREQLTPAERAALSDRKPDHVAGTCIAAYYAAVEADPSLEGRARDALRRLFAGDEALREQKGRLTADATRGQMETYASIGSEFDRQVFESREAWKAVELLGAGLDSGVFARRGDGSVGIDLTDDGFWDVTLARPDGTTTAYLQHASGWDHVFRAFDPDATFFLVGPDWVTPGQAAELLYEKLAIPWRTRFTTFHHGLVRSPSGRLRSRFGEALTVDSVLADVVARVASGEVRGPAGDRLSEHAAHFYGLALLKYFFLRVPRQKDVVYDASRLWDVVAGRFGSALDALEVVRQRVEGEEPAGGTPVPPRPFPFPPPTRELGLCVDDLHLAAHRSLHDLDPVFLVRYLDRLSSAVHRNANVTGIPSGLWHNVLRCFAEAFRLMNMEVPLLVPA